MMASYNCDREKQVLEISSSALYECARNVENFTDYQQQQHFDRRGVPILDVVTLSYADFFEKYLVQNYPCILEAEELINGWNASKDWTQYRQSVESGETAIVVNFDFLSQKYGEEVVNVTNCDTILESDGCGTSEMSIKEFLEYWKEYSSNAGEKTLPCLYLKDWHFMRADYTRSNAEHSPYEVPSNFHSDWLNEYCTELVIDDFRFCYMGPKGSWTAFHSDVYGSFSWSATIFGRKKWRIYSPQKARELYGVKQSENGKSDSKIQYNYDEPGVQGIDFHDIIQEAGQIIFIPSGWFHIVWNLEDTISINHNWFNGANVMFVWESIRNALDEVEKELEDLKSDPEYSSLCQSLLKANHGMNYEEFMDILLYIRTSRKHMNFLPPSQQFFVSSTLGLNHVKYDLQHVEEVIELIENDSKKRRISFRRQ